MLVESRGKTPLGPRAQVGSSVGVKTRLRDVVSHRRWPAAEVTPLAEGPERRQVLGLDAGGCLRSMADPWPWRSLMVIAHH
jgi:hypothetical protein